MKHIENYTVRWHDTDAFRRVRPTRMLVYMQETSNLHMMSRGMSLDELRDKKKLAFILSKIRMKIYAPLYLGEDIEVQTWTYETRGLGTGRFYRILRDGEIIAERGLYTANSLPKSSLLEFFDTAGDIIGNPIVIILLCLAGLALLASPFISALRASNSEEE